MKKVALLTSLMPFSMLLGTSSLWIAPPPGGGDWGVAGNWSPAVVPNAVGDTANFTNGIGSNDPVTLTTVSPKVGFITLSNTLGNAGYIISSPGANSLTFQVSSGNASLTVPLGNLGLHVISAPIVLASSLDLTQASAVTPGLAISGVMSGGGALSTGGAGTTLLLGQNTFTGGLTVTGGTLQCGQATVLPIAGSVTMTGGTLDLDNNAQTIRGLAGTAPITLGSATLTINTTAANSYGGQISGIGGGLTVGGSGSLTLTNTSSYTGVTTVTSGTLQLGITNALPAGRDVQMTGGVLNLSNFNQNVGNLSGTGGSITLGTGQLGVALGASQNFAGVISGSGPVNFNGGGFVWTLGAAQTYTGLTTIGNGTIRLGVSNGLPAGGPVTLTATGILDLNNLSQTVGTLTAAAGAQIHLGSGHLTVVPTASANFAGVIDGGGGVTFQGPFTWVIQAPQTYTGGTTINGGVMELAVANGIVGAAVVNSPGTLALDSNPLALTSIAGSGNINLGGGVLTLNTTGTTTFSGPIVGAGGQLIVQGSGTQILTGTNSYSGGTAVSGTATLQGTTSSLQGIVVNNSTLYFNQSFNGTFAGPLSGAGVLQVGGGGIVTFTGTPTQGSVSVLSGELDIGAGSNLTATTITVSSGAALGGDGTLTANILNSGMLNPGGTGEEGTLTVNGNLTFFPGSSYSANLTPTMSDHLIVNGQVTIQSDSVILANVQKALYEEDTQFTIIASTLPVAGTFQGAVQPDPFLVITFLYNQPIPGFAGSVILDLQIRSIGDVIQGGNAGAIATCITQANMRRDPDLEHLIAQLIFLPVDQVRKVLDEMQPSQLRALTVAEQTNALFAQQTLNWRMAQFDRSTCEKEMNPCFPWNFWASLGGNWTDQRPADHNVGYEAPAAGLTAGFDGRVSERLYLGCALEYGHTALDWKEAQGSATINRMSAGPYLSYIGRFGYANASLLASFAHFDASRHVPFFDRIASSSHTGETVIPHLDAGIVFHPAPQVSLTPFAMVDFLFGWEGGYQETGADSLNFTIASSSSRMMRSELGLKIAKCATRSHTRWVHDLKASWVREQRFKGKDLTATFRQFPCSFTVQGLFPSRSFLDVGMGLTFIFKNDRFAATLRYEGQFGEGVTIQSGIARLLSRF